MLEKIGVKCVRYREYMRESESVCVCVFVV